jgi:hypothetical protein
MIAVIQSLLSLTPLTEALKGSGSSTDIATPFTNTLAKLASSPSTKTLLPLQKLVSSKFQPILQHDAHEFFIFLLT